MGLLKTVLVDDESMVVYSVIFVGPKVYWKVGGQRVHVWRWQSDLFRQIAKAMAADPRVAGNIALLFEQPIFRKWVQFWAANVIGEFRGYPESREFFKLAFDEHWKMVTAIAEDMGRISARQRFGIP